MTGPNPTRVKRHSLQMPARVRHQNGLGHHHTGPGHQRASLPSPYGEDEMTVSPASLLSHKDDISGSTEVKYLQVCHDHTTGNEDALDFHDNGQQHPLAALEEADHNRDKTEIDDTNDQKLDWRVTNTTQLSSPRPGKTKQLHSSQYIQARSQYAQIHENNCSTGQ